MNSLLVPAADELQPEYFDATVTHTNKYNRGAGIYLLHFFFSGMMQDVVFKLDSNGTDYPMTLNNIDLALYPGQRVKLILINNRMVAYIDPNTGNYQYITNNLKKTLDMGIGINWVLVVIVTFFLSFLLSNLYGPGTTLSLYPFFLPAVVWLYQRMYNYLLEKRIDTFIIGP